jgi:hypothetical protein
MKKSPFKAGISAKYSLPKHPTAIMHAPRETRRRSEGETVGSGSTYVGILVERKNTSTRNQGTR